MTTEELDSVSRQTPMAIRIGTLKRAFTRRRRPLRSRLTWPLERDSVTQLASICKTEGTSSA